MLSVTNTGQTKFISEKIIKSLSRSSLTNWYSACLLIWLAIVRSRVSGEAHGNLTRVFRGLTPSFHANETDNLNVNNNPISTTFLKNPCVTCVRRTSHIRWTAQAPDATPASRVQDGCHDDLAGWVGGTDAQGAHNRRHPAHTGRGKPVQQIQAPRSSTRRTNGHTRAHSQWSTRTGVLGLAPGTRGSTYVPCGTSWPLSQMVV